MAPVCALAFVLSVAPRGGCGEPPVARTGLSIDFAKQVPTDPNEPEVLGTVYHAPPDLTLIEVRRPISQRVLVDTAHVTIYYPAEERAIRLPTSGPMALLFLHAFVGIADVDMDLDRYGFEIDRTDVGSDSLIVWWRPPELLGSGIEQARTVFSRDRLAEVSFYAEEGELLQRTRFGEYAEHGGHAYPMRIEISVCLPELKTEVYRMSSPSFDRALPDSLLSLRLPPHVRIEDAMQ